MPPRKRPAPSAGGSSTVSQQAAKRVTRSVAKGNISGSSAESSTAGSTSGGRKMTTRKGTRANPIEIPDDSFEDIELPPEILDEQIEFVKVLEKKTSRKPLLPPSPPLSIAIGGDAWRQDFNRCKRQWGVLGEVEVYVGMMGIIQNFKSGDSDNSMLFKLVCEDVDGRNVKLDLQIIMSSINTYPSNYSCLIFSDSDVSKPIQKVFDRFTDIYELDLEKLILRLVSALQGDDEANGGALPEMNSDEDDDPMDDELEEGDWDQPVNTGFETASGVGGIKSRDLVMLKDHFLQGKKMGYRPGLSMVSEDMVISYSIPLKNLPIDPNVLAMWDDGLVEAWRTDQRFILMVRTETYPPVYNKMQYYLTFDSKYKPNEETMISIIRDKQPSGFYLSSPLTTALRSFPRCFQLRTTWGINWASADRVGMCERESREVLQEGKQPKNEGPMDDDDPVARGYENNLALCAFYWVLRRFMEAPKYCQNCGLEVSVVSARPYVCDSDLCLYAFMSLGLGPSVEYVIQTHPAVVDILLSFAHSAASTTTRMELPLNLHIEVPPEAGLEPSLTILDQVTDKRKALVWLIDQLPKVSEIKAHLDSGGSLKSLEAPSGSIGVLRWVVGSCRAYLKEVKPGEGVLNPLSGAHTGGAFRQFIFVVGSPAQETAFKEEVRLAKETHQNCHQYPTMLVFHGSATDRWHNILRTGLDYTEIANARAYGNGVYFAHDAATSLGSYSRQTTTPRSNADFPINKAVACVELVNVVGTFVSSNPYYVVGNVKQIKPFLLLVQGTGDHAPQVESDGPLFVHDPALRLRPSWFSQPLRVKMPEKLIKTTFKDSQPDNKEDADIIHPPKPILAKTKWKPSPKSRFDKIQLMPPPIETSIMTTRALAKEFKATVNAQERGELPFWVDPETENLYCWVVEMFDFSEDSKFMEDMKRFRVDSVIAEIRFPATFPHSPPFMRILHPRCLPFSMGGGGNITAGGSVCNEILTMTGWNPAFCVEAIIRDIMTNMTEATPPARLDPRRWDTPYTMTEAIEAYKRVAMQHGWQIPKDFDKLN